MAPLLGCGLTLMTALAFKRLRLALMDYVLPNGNGCRLAVGEGGWAGMSGEKVV